LLGGDRGGDLVGPFVRELLELEHDARAGERRRVRPAGERGGRDLDRGVELGLGRERHLGLHLAGRRVEDVGRAAALPLDFLAPDKMMDCPHDGTLPVNDICGQYRTVALQANSGSPSRRI
jgi:hypothetical protein